MEIHQIMIRPQGNQVFVMFLDALGERSSIVFDSTGNATVASLIEECRQKIPSDANNPRKTLIQQEIASLEDRLTKLKSAIGQ